MFCNTPDDAPTDRVRSLAIVARAVAGGIPAPDDDQAVAVGRLGRLDKGALGALIWQPIHAILAPQDEW